jgi:hypothetical protein
LPKYKLKRKPEQDEASSQFIVTVLIPESKLPSSSLLAQVELIDLE